MGIFEDHLQGVDGATAVTSNGWVTKGDIRSDSFGASANLRWFVTRAFYLQLLGGARGTAERVPSFTIETYPSGSVTYPAVTATASAWNVRVGVGGRF